MSINWGMDKQNFFYPFNEILAMKMQWSTDTCYNMDEPWKHAQFKKPYLKHVTELHLYEMSRKGKSIGDCLQLGELGRNEER